ncbi:unnamed protein product [Sphagnum tenellum]
MEVQGCSENGTHSRIRRGPCHKELSWRDLFSSGRDCIAGSWGQRSGIIAYKSSFSENVNDDIGASGEAGTAGHGEP